MPLKKFSRPSVRKDLNKGKNIKNLKKKCTISQKKNAKIRDVQMLKPFHYRKKLCNNLLFKPIGGSLATRAKKKCQKFSRSLKTFVQNSINLRF